MKLIVGLGNPGTQYAGTRHNVGFEVVELLAKRHNIAITKRNHQGVFGEGNIQGEKALLLRPMTYMNLSGDCVAAITRFYKIPNEDIIIVLDDTDLPLGKLRLRFKGSAGGHNGLNSILQRLQTQEIPRIRIGVGASRPGDQINHVLSKFTKEERPLIDETTLLACQAIECALKENFEIAMNRYNASPT